jgi:hypothetical protein
MRYQKFLCKLFFVLMLVNFNSKVFSQNQGNVWVFGDHTSVDFNSGSPISGTSALCGTYNTSTCTVEGVASISDNSGNLLFYTNGMNVYTKSHVQMPNGFGLYGSSTATQSGIIVPKPGSSTQFIIFTVDAWGGAKKVKYNIVDMTANGGNGDVIAKNQSMPYQVGIEPAGLAEKITAIPKTGGIGFWLVAHGARETSGNFYIWDVSCSGANSGILPAKVQAIGTPCVDSYLIDDANTLGYMKISRQGSTLAYAATRQGYVEVFNFNQTNGTLSNVRKANFPGAYGLEFSPNGKMLYAGDLYNPKILKLDLAYYNFTSSGAAQVLTFTASGALYGGYTGYYTTGALQVAPNGLIYAAMVGRDHLLAINNPDLSPNIVENSFSLNSGQYVNAGHYCSAGLPNFVPSFIGKVVISVVASKCTMDFSYSAGTNLTNPTYNWNFGDGTSSTQSAPHHTYLKNGNFNVILRVTDPSGCSASSSAYVTVTNAAAPLTVTAAPSAICPGGTTTLTATGGDTYTWTQTLGGGLASTSGALVNATPALGTTTATYTVNALKNGCPAQANSIMVTVNGVTTGINATRMSMCLGATTVLTATGANTYSWSQTTGGGLSATNGANVSATPTAVGNYSYTATGTNALGCKNSKSIAITVTSAPVPNAITGQNATCPNQANIPYQIVPLGGETNFSWTGSNGVKVNGTASGTALTSITANAGNVSGNITVDMTFSCGVTITRSKKIDMLASQTILVASKTILCDAEAVTLTASNATAGSTFSWTQTTGGGLAATNGAVVNATPAKGTTTATYSVSGTSNGCPASLAHIDVTVNNPSLTISTGSSTICSGSTMALTASGGDTYTWTQSNGGGLGATTGTVVNATPITGTTTTPVTYTVNGIKNGCPAQANSTVVTVNPSPVIDVTAARISMCLGATTTLTATGSNNYTWMQTAGGGLSSTNGATVNVSPTAVGDFTYSATGMNSFGCQNTKSIVVTIIPTPVPNFVDGVNSVCPNEANIPFSIIPIGGETNYSWTGNNGVTVNGNTSGPALTGITANAGVVYGNIIVNMTFACGVTIGRSQKLQMLASPTSLVASKTTICAGEKVTLTASNATPNTSYNFTQTPGGGLSNLPSGPIVDATPTAGTTTVTYTVAGTSSYCPASFASVVVTVNNYPLTVTAAPPTICSGNTTTLTAGGGDSYSWTQTTGGGLTATTGAVVNAIPNSGTTSSTYTVNGMKNGCQAQSSSVIVSVNSLPVIGISATKVNMCLGAVTSLTATGADTYTWIQTAGGGLSASIGTNVNATPTAIGDYTYTVTGTNASGCQNTQNIVVKVIAAPVPDVVTGVNAACPNQANIPYQITPVVGAINYAWTGTNGVTINGASAGPALTNILANASNVNGNIIVNISLACGVTIGRSQQIQMIPLPVVDVTATRISMCLGAVTALTATGANTYSWTQTAGGGLSATNGPNVNATPNAVGDFTYIVTGTNAAGCQNTKNIVVTVIPAPVPNSVIGVNEACPNQANILYQIAPIGGETNYVWSGTDGVTVNSPSAGPALTSIYANASNVYGNIVVNMTFSCGITIARSQKIQMIPLPVVDITATRVNICLGVSTTLTATGAETYTWTQTAGGSLSATNGPNVIATPTAVGTYTYTATGTSFSGCQNTKSIVVTVIPVPVPNSVTGINEACPNQANIPFQIIPIGGETNYVWTGTDGVTVNGASAGPALANITANASNVFGNIIVNVTFGCGVTIGRSQQINMLATPSTLVASKTTICESEVISLTANNATPGTTFSWIQTPGGGLATTVGPVVNASPTFGTTSATYTVLSTSNGCPAQATSVSVTVNPLPVLDVTTTRGQICIGVVNTLTATGADSYTWAQTIGGGLSATIGATVNTAPSTVGDYTYTVTGTNVSGCQNTKNIVVSVIPTPVPNGVIGVNAACPNQTNIPYQITPVGGETNYTWTGTDGVTVNGLSAGPALSQIMANASNVYGNIIVKVTFSCGVTIGRSQKIQMIALPVVDVTATRVSMCLGAVSALAATGANTFTWAQTAGGGLSATNGANVNATPTAVGDYTFLATGTNSSGCQSTKNIVVTVTAAPVPNLVTGITQACPNQANLPYQIVPIGGETNYAWTGTDGVTVNGISSGSALTNITANAGNVSGNIVVNVTFSCGVTINRIQHIDMLATPTTITGRTAICPAEVVSLTANNTTPGTSFSWTQTAGGGLVTTSGPVVTANLSAGTTNATYTVSSTSNGCPTQTTSVLVTVPALPVVDVTATRVSMCLGAISTLTGTGADTYTWSQPAGGGLSATNGTNVNATPTAVGIYTYTATGTNVIGCQNNKSIDITVNPAPVPNWVMGYNQVCPYQTNIAYQISPIGGETFYSWRGTDGVTVNGTSSGPAITDITANAGNVYGNIVVNITFSCGVTIGRSQKIQMLPVPAFDITASRQSMCLGASSDFRVTGSDWYTWTQPLGGGLTALDGPFSTATPTAVGDYTYIVKGRNGSGCESSKSIVVTVLPAPIPNGVTGQNSACPNQANIPYKIVPIGGETNYVWTGTNGVTINGANAGPALTNITANASNVYGNIVVNVTFGCGVTIGRSQRIQMLACKNDVATAAPNYDKEDVQLLHVYPNPTTGQITVTLNEGENELEIQDLLGRQVYKAKGLIEPSIQIDLSNQPKGVYILNVKGSLPKRIILQ